MVPLSTLGTHAFSCKRSSSRILRHNYIWHALTRAGIPRMKEQHGLVRDDSKRPDGLTLLPWNSGRSAIWDVTVVYTLGNAYLQQSAITSVSAAETAVRKKTNIAHSAAPTSFFQCHCKHLDMNVSTQEFLVHIGRRLTEVTTDPCETTFLFQHLSVAV